MLISMIVIPLIGCFVIGTLDASRKGYDLLIRKISLMVSTIVWILSTILFVAFCTKGFQNNLINVSGILNRNCNGTVQSFNTNNSLLPVLSAAVIQSGTKDVYPDTLITAQKPFSLLESIYNLPISWLLALALIAFVIASVIAGPYSKAMTIRADPTFYGEPKSMYAHFRKGMLNGSQITHSSPYIQSITKTHRFYLIYRTSIILSFITLFCITNADRDLGLMYYLHPFVTFFNEWLIYLGCFGAGVTILILVIRITDATIYTISRIVKRNSRNYIALSILALLTVLLLIYTH